jgi:hypothetical protein
MAFQIPPLTGRTRAAPSQRRAAQAEEGPPSAQLGVSNQDFLQQLIRAQEAQTIDPSLIHTQPLSPDDQPTLPDPPSLIRTIRQIGGTLSSPDYYRDLLREIKKFTPIQSVEDLTRGSSFASLASEAIEGREPSDPSSPTLFDKLVGAADVVTLGAFPPKSLFTGAMRLTGRQAPGIAPTFFSRAALMTKQLLPTNTTSDHARNILKNNIKPSEWAFLDLDGYFARNTGRNIDRQDLLDYIEANNLNVVQVSRRSIDDWSPETITAGPPRVIVPPGPAGDRHIDLYLSDAHILERDRLVHGLAKDWEEAQIITDYIHGARDDLGNIPVRQRNMLRGQESDLRKLRDELQSTYRPSPAEFSPSPYSSQSLPGGTNYQENLIIGARGDERLKTPYWSELNIMGWTRTQAFGPGPLSYSEIDSIINKLTSTIMRHNVVTPADTTAVAVYIRGVSWRDASVLMDPMNRALAKRTIDDILSKLPKRTVDEINRQREVFASLPDLGRTFHIEELQSKWSQKRRRYMGRRKIWDDQVEAAEKEFDAFFSENPDFTLYHDLVDDALDKIGVPRLQQTPAAGPRRQGVSDPGAALRGTPEQRRAAFRAADERLGLLAYGTDSKYRRQHYLGPDAAVRRMVRDQEPGVLYHRTPYEESGWSSELGTTNDPLLGKIIEGMNGQQRRKLHMSVEDLAGMRHDQALGLERIAGIANPVPPLPHPRWQQLTLRRMMRQAVDEGHDTLSWVTGETIAKRNNIFGHFNAIEATSTGTSGRYGIRVQEFGADNFTNPLGRTVQLTPDEFEAYLGPEPARKLRELVEKMPAHKGLSVADNLTFRSELQRAGNLGAGTTDEAIDEILDWVPPKGSSDTWVSAFSPYDPIGSLTTTSLDVALSPKLVELGNKRRALGRPSTSVLRDIDVTTTPDWPKQVYDRGMVSQMNKFGKPWGIQVEMSVLPNGEPVHIFRINDKMRESVRAGGELFSMPPPIPLMRAGRESGEGDEPSRARPSQQRGAYGRLAAAQAEKPESDKFELLRSTQDPVAKDRIAQQLDFINFLFERDPNMERQ